MSRVCTPDGQPNNVPDVDNRQEGYAPPRWAELLSEGMVRVRFSTFNSFLIREALSKDAVFLAPIFSMRFMAAKTSIIHFGSLARFRGIWSEEAWRPTFAQ